ncbi:MAG: sensor histidine kinase [Candidatus Thermochlorobacter sp.]
MKNPLQAIVGFSHLIDELNDIAKVKEMNKTIRRNAERMFGLISDFLEQANVEQQVQNLETSLTNLSVLTQQVISHFTPQAALKQQTIMAQIESDCFAVADSVLIQSVLENLLSNAIKYSPEGKTIRVNCEKRQAKIKQQKTKDKVRLPPMCIRISVQDEGQGLSEEDMKQLFGKFKRLSATPTGGESSTGLGLYLARQIIDRHGGRIWAESDGKDKGATFFIELPAAVERATEA